MSPQNTKHYKTRQAEKSFLWLVEQEKFRNNIRNLQSIAAEVAARQEEFDRLFAETQQIRAETRWLRRMMNKTALKFGLEPFDSRKNGL